MLSVPNAFEGELHLLGKDSQCTKQISNIVHSVRSFEKLAERAAARAAMYARVGVPDGMFALATSIRAPRVIGNLI